MPGEILGNAHGKKAGEMFCGDKVGVASISVYEETVPLPT